MAKQQSIKLAVEPREEAGTRASRRLRRDGIVPGVLYGYGEDAAPFKVSRKDLRLALIEGSQLLDVSLGSADPIPAVVKEQQRHPLDGSLIHLDLMKVRLDKKIQAAVHSELLGAEGCPGAKEGGIVEHVTRELTIEALPTEIPESIEVDVSEMDIGDNLTVADLMAGVGYEIVDDPEQVVVTVSAPRKIEELEPEVEEEAEVIGEGEEGAEGEAAEGEGGGESQGEGEGGGE